MTYDYTLYTNAYTGFVEVENRDEELVAELKSTAMCAIFIAGASALRLSVYDGASNHGLCGTLDQVMNEGTKA